VVGCGLGTDAEHIAGLGFETVAFDVAPTAIETARRRFPGSPVRYTVADLLDPPGEWRQAFDLVFESLTVQSLPVEVHAEAIARVRDTVAPGGTLLVVAAARDDGPVPDGPPWPLTRAEVEAFAGDELRPVRIEQLRGDPGTPPRWRAELARP
jgi:SAM-dependent methyltransferase